MLSNKSNLYSSFKKCSNLLKKYYPKLNFFLYLTDFTIYINFSSYLTFIFIINNFNKFNQNKNNFKKHLKNLLIKDIDNKFFTYKYYYKNKLPYELLSFIYIIKKKQIDDNDILDLFDIILENHEKKHFVEKSDFFEYIEKLSKIHNKIINKIVGENCNFENFISATLFTDIIFNLRYDFIENDKIYIPVTFKKNIIFSDEIRTYNIESFCLKKFLNYKYNRIGNIFLITNSPIFNNIINNFVILNLTYYNKIDYNLPNKYLFFLELYRTYNLKKISILIKDPELLLFKNANTLSFFDKLNLFYKIGISNIINFYYNKILFYLKLIYY